MAYHGYHPSVTPDWQGEPVPDRTPQQRKSIARVAGQVSKDAIGAANMKDPLDDLRGSEDYPTRGPAYHKTAYLSPTIDERTVQRGTAMESRIKAGTLTSKRRSK